MRNSKRKRNRNGRPQRQISRRRPQPARRGSTLLIVLVLMGMLSLLGVIFYTFAAQERSNSEYYSEAAKERTEPSLSADTLFDWALEQIIVGTDPRLKNSMLWGSRHSLLSNALGVGVHRPGDLHPFNGEGINVIFDSTTGQIGVDQNHDGQIEPGNAYLLDWVDSPAARNAQETRPWVKPQPDVGYTYPDINNPFLCYVGKVRDENGQVHQVVKPSYLLPGLLRTATGAPLPSWYNSTTATTRSMRAHPNHVYVPPTTTNTTPPSRYLTDAEAVSLIGAGEYGFPFTPMASNYDTSPSGTGPVYTQGRMGPYSKISATPNAAAPNGDDPIEFDYDNDGDGIPESILIDLDFPAQQDSAGKLFVPLFLVTIHDLDALMNLSAHGNLAKVLYGPTDVSNGMATTPVSNTGAPFGTDTSSGSFYYVSQSNLGLGPAEVNPLWALTGRVGTDGSGGVFTQHQRFFGAAPQILTGSLPPWGETANQELLWAKIGRPHYSTSGSIQELLPGAYGEENLLYQAVSGGSLSAAGGASLPRPGISMQDDDGNLNDGQGVAPFFGHPLDFTGQGTYLSSGSSKQIAWLSQGPNRWISYSRYNNNSTSPSSSNVLWGQRNSLMQNTLLQGNGDDPYEIAYYPTDKRAVDNLFDPDEMLYLQSNNSEISRMNVTSRLSKLLPFNFAKTTADNARGEAIRRKFTVISNDRKNYSLPYVNGGRSAWEYTTDTAPLGGNLGPYVRNPNTNTLRFPPEFGAGGTPVRRYSTIISGATAPYTEDPFRPFVRALLEADVDFARSQASLQRKLSVNHLFTYDAATGQYMFRKLMPHPDDPGTASIATTYPAPMPNVPYPPTNSTSQEYWARRDRQQMARDIYVLLYLLGHGDDTVNTAATSNPNPSAATDGTTLYSDVQLREMAQFAVNVVDSLDRDSVMTRFEYDKDLSDGWNLDDDPFSPAESAAYGTGSSNYNASYPNDGASRGEVFGIENHDLTLNEALVINTVALNSGNASDTNPGCTPFDDTTSRNFAYVELFNRSPFDVAFTNSEEWQVVLKKEGTGAFERRVSLGNGAGTITSGGLFTIGSADYTESSVMTGRSTFRVDPAGMSGMAFQRIAPTSNITSATGIDLVDEATSGSLTGKARIENQAGSDLTSTAGSWAAGFGGMSPSDPNLKVVLRRRAHPTRSRLASTDVNDNPWVDVDTMSITVGTFSLADTGAPGSGSMAMNVTSQLENLPSRERPEPLNRSGEQVYPTSSGSNIYNSLLVTNNNPSNPPPATFTIWQPHFDRDFASVLDLLLIPVFGPAELTREMRAAQKDTLEGQITDQLGVGAVGAKLAAAKFMVPEDPSNYSNASPSRYLDNRWHRVLEFLEVPTRTNSNLGIGSDLTIARVPGRVNWNTLRHPECLGGLIDDSNTLTLRIDGTDNTGAPYHPADPEAGELFDRFEGTGRNWWDQFVRSRDPIDPYWQSSIGIEVPLPGLPGSKPFRSLATVGYTSLAGVRHASVQDTILRALPSDVTAVPDPMATAGTRRRLLEIGNLTEHNSSSVDPLIRYRLMSKIANNSTTRSNSFAIFVSVKYFSAAADPANNGAIRIGGPYNGKQEPEHRGFFIVDRSKLEQGQYSGLPTYDFRTFVEYRKTLKTQ